METQEEEHRQGRLAQGFLEDHMEHLKTRAESNLSSSEELIEQARKGQVEAKPDIRQGVGQRLRRVSRLLVRLL